MSRKEVGIVLKAYDQASRQLGGVTRSLDRMKRSLLSLTAGYLGGRALTGVFAGAVREFAAFELGMARIHTMLDEGSSRHLPQYAREIDHMSRQYGESAASLQDATYDILSGSIAAGEAMSVLRANTIAAKGGFTSTATATKAAVGILNAYSLAAEKTGRVQDILAATVKRGVITYEELAGGIGNVTSIGAVLGVDLEALTAAIATFTRAGVAADTAIMSLKNILVTFQNPTAAARQVAAELGFELDASSIKGRGLIEVMNKLKDANAAQLKILMPNIRGLVGFAAGLNNAADMGQDYLTMLDSAGRSQEAFNKAAGTMSMEMDKSREEWNALKRDVGKEFRPFGAEFLKNLRDTLGLLNDIGDALTEISERDSGEVLREVSRRENKTPPGMQRVFRPGPGAAGGYYETVPIPPARGGFQGGRFESYKLDLPATDFVNDANNRAWLARFLEEDFPAAVNRADESARRPLTPLAGDLTGTTTGADGASAGEDPKKIAFDITAAYRRMANDMNRTSRESWEVRSDLLDKERDKYLASMETIKDKALVLKWYAEQEKKLAIEKDKAVGGPLEGFAAGIRELKRELPTVGELGADVARELRDGIVGSLSDAVFEARNLSDALREVGRSMARMAFEWGTRQVVTQGMNALFAAAAGGSGAGSGPGGTIGATTTAATASGPLGSFPVMHGGGMVGRDRFPTRPVMSSLFAGAPRLHDGLRGDEFPAILQRGERVIPRGDAASPTAPALRNEIHYHGYRQPKISAAQFQQRGSEWVAKIVIDDLDYGGPISGRLGKG